MKVLKFGSYQQLLELSHRGQSIEEPRGKQLGVVEIVEGVPKGRKPVGTVCQMFRWDDGWREWKWREARMVEDQGTTVPRTPPLGGTRGGESDDMIGLIRLA